MNIFFTKIKYSLFPFFILIAGISTAQTVHRDFKFKKGDEFQRQIVVKSNCLLQRGGQKLNISTYSAVTKSYKVNDVRDKNTVISITTNKIIDSINALGQKVSFNSENRPDPNSSMQMSLLQMIGKPAVVLVDYKGAILSVPNPVHNNDTLLSFTGIQPEKLDPAMTLEFLLDFPANSFLRKGLTWNDDNAAPTIRRTKYTINDVTSRTTTIVYESSILEDALSTRINGVLMIDNDSGVVLKRSTQSVTTGYELVKGVLYSVIRRSATSEVCYKK